MWVEDSEPELVGEHQSRRRRQPRPSHHFAHPQCPLCAVRKPGWDIPEALSHSFLFLRFLPEDLHPNQVSQAGGQSCLSSPSDPVSFCPQLRSSCPFPFSQPRRFVGAAITCFRKRASLSTHTARPYRRPGHSGKLGW